MEFSHEMDLQRKIFPCPGPVAKSNAFGRTLRSVPRIGAYGPMTASQRYGEQNGDIMGRATKGLPGLVI